MEALPAAAEAYYPKRKARDKAWREVYHRIAQETDVGLHGTYLIDLLRGIDEMETTDLITMTDRRAYDVDYLDDAMRNLGDAVDFAVMTLNLEPDVFGAALSASHVAWQFSMGNPRYVAGMNGCAFARAVLEDSDTPYVDADDAMYADGSPEYWAGWALAFYQWYSGLSFGEILASISLDHIIEMYPVYHEMDISRFVDRMEKILERT